MFRLFTSQFPFQTPLMVRECGMKIAKYSIITARSIAQSVCAIMLRQLLSLYKKGSLSHVVDVYHVERQNKDEFPVRA